jgi:hypothetical protein
MVNFGHFFSVYVSYNRNILQKGWNCSIPIKWRVSTFFKKEQSNQGRPTLAFVRSFPKPQNVPPPVAVPPIRSYRSSASTCLRAERTE